MIAALFPDGWTLGLAAPFVGSFLGTLALRLPAGAPVIASRSMCPECHRRLGPLEMVPVLSWLALQGRCRTCSHEIPLFYPAVELLALGVVLWAAALTSGAVLLASCLLGWLLIALGAMDVVSLRLSDALNAALAMLGLGATWLVVPDTLVDHIIGAVAGFALIACVAFTYRLWRGRDGVGLGDAKFLAAAGAWVGWQALGSVLLLGSAAALVAVLAAWTLGQRIRADFKIPFGPFLAFGLWLTWLYGPMILWSA